MAPTLRGQPLQANILRSIQLRRTPRLTQLEGLFDIPTAGSSTTTYKVNLPLDQRPWHIGLITGPSGSGKSTIAAHFWPDQLAQPNWSPESAIIDDFPAALGIHQITELLSSVGLSSPPAWRRPYFNLSTGEQFRAAVARKIADNSTPIVIDEFTSVVDRTVAKIASHAIARTIRRTGRQLVALSCHADIIDWLQPDWLYSTLDHRLTWRHLRPRPQLDIHISRTNTTVWPAFRDHHYLSAAVAPTASCYLATYNDRPAAFAAVLPFPHANRPGWREHRIVCLPDFQGIGIGNALSEFIGACYSATGRPYRSITSHPAMRAHRLRSPFWRCTRPPSLMKPNCKLKALSNQAANNRLTSSFEYIGPTNPQAATLLNILK